MRKKFILLTLSIMSMTSFAAIIGTNGNVDVPVSVNAKIVKLESQYKVVVDGDENTDSMVFNFGDLIPGQVATKTSAFTITKGNSEMLVADKQSLSASLGQSTQEFNSSKGTKVATLNYGLTFDPVTDKTITSKTGTVQATITVENTINENVTLGNMNVLNFKVATIA